MNIIAMPGSMHCESCGSLMGVKPLQPWDSDATHVLIVCGQANCLREGKVLKFPLTRVNCAPAIAGSEKAQTKLVLAS